MLRSPASVKPWHIDKNVNFFVYPFHRRRKGVCQWNILFGCVRVGHRYMENQNIAHVVRRFPLVHSKGEFRVVGAEPSCVSSDAGETGHIPN